MAWISVPDLALHVSAQRYEHLRMEAGRAVVRFTDEGMFKGFTSELELDEDGLVRVYPGLAARVGRPRIGQVRTLACGRIAVTPTGGGEDGDQRAGSSAGRAGEREWARQ